MTRFFETIPIRYCRLTGTQTLESNNFTTLLDRFNRILSYCYYILTCTWLRGHSIVWSNWTASGLPLLGLIKSIFLSLILFYSIDFWLVNLLNLSLSLVPGWLQSHVAAATTMLQVACRRPITRICEVDQSSSKHQAHKHQLVSPKCSIWSILLPTSSLILFYS